MQVYRSNFKPVYSSTFNPRNLHMNPPLPTLKSALALAVLSGFAVAASAQTIVYSETFDPAPASLVTNTANIQLGGSTKPNTAKYVVLDQWGLNPVAGIVDIGGTNGNVLQPRSVVAQNGRSAGIFLSPDLFAATGAGTYTLSFDVVPSSTGVGRVYIGAGSGYDLSLNTEAMLNLNLSSNGFGVKKADGSIVWPALTASGGATATHLLTTSTEWIDLSDNPTGQFRDVPGAPLDVQTGGTVSFNFEYDGSSTIVLAFGGYDTDFKVDNISIATAVPVADTWAGYPRRPDGYVDTAGFLGWIWVSDTTDYVLSVSLGHYIFLPESSVSESGAWTYISR